VWSTGLVVNEWYQASVSSLHSSTTGTDADGFVRPLHVDDDPDVDWTQTVGEFI